MKGRVQLEITKNLAKAEAACPWATAFIIRKYGIWCFESKQDRDALKPGEMPVITKENPR
jgi:hypothetical protein